MQIVGTQGHRGSGGVGAVVLDGGGDFYAGLNQQLAGRIDANRAREAQEANAKATRSQALVANLKFNPNGARPQDLDMLAKEYQDIETKAAQLYSQYNGNVPRDVWMKEVEVPQAQSLANIEKSVAVNKYTQAVQNDYQAKPDTYDTNVAEQGLATIQVAPLSEAAELMKKPILVRATPAFLPEYVKAIDAADKTKELVLDKNGKAIEVDLGGGVRGFQEKEYVPAEKVRTIADGFWNDDLKRKGIEKAYNENFGQEPTELALKQSWEDMYKATGVSPARLYAYHIGDKANAAKLSTHSKGRDYIWEKEINQQYEDKAAAKDAIMFMEQFGALKAGKARMYPQKGASVQGVETSGAYGLFPKSVTVAPTFFSDALTGFKDEPVVIEGVDGYGNKTMTSVPSVIRSVKIVGDQVYYKSDFTISEGMGVDGFVPLSEADAYRLGKMNGIPDKAMRSFLIENGGYDGKIVNTAATTDPKEPTVQQQGAPVTMEVGKTQQVAPKQSATTKQEAKKEFKPNKTVEVNGQVFPFVETTGEMESAPSGTVFIVVENGKYKKKKKP